MFFLPLSHFPFSLSLSALLYLERNMGELNERTNLRRGRETEGRERERERGRERGRERVKEMFKKTNTQRDNRKHAQTHTQTHSKYITHSITTINKGYTGSCYILAFMYYCIIN